MRQKRSTAVPPGLPLPNRRELFPPPFGHVELSFADGRTGIVSGDSAPARQTRNYCYADPETARAELFKSVLNPEAVNSDNDMLSFLQGKEGLAASGIAGTCPPNIF